MTKKTKQIHFKTDLIRTLKITQAKNDFPVSAISVSIMFPEMELYPLVTGYCLVDCESTNLL